MLSHGTEYIKQSNRATLGACTGTIAVVIGLLSISSPSFSKDPTAASFDNYTRALRTICPEKSLEHLSPSDLLNSADRFRSQLTKAQNSKNG